MRARPQLGFLRGASSQSTRNSQSVHYVTLTALLVIPGWHIADPRGKYPGWTSLHREERMARVLFVFFNLSTWPGLREDPSCGEDSKHSYPLSVCHSWHRVLGNLLGTSVPGLG